MLNHIIYFLPYILIFLSLYLFDNIINFLKKEFKINIPLITVMAIMIVTLITYYIPVNNILENYNLNYIQVQVYEEKQQRIDIKVEDNSKVNKLLEAINNHRFIRSAVRSVEQQNFADTQTIMLTSNQWRPMKIIQLYILKDNKKNDALIINNQVYIIKDSEGLSKEILDILQQFGVLDS